MFPIMICLPEKECEVCEMNVFIAFVVDGKEPIFFG